MHLHHIEPDPDRGQTYSCSLYSRSPCESSRSLLYRRSWILFLCCVTSLRFFRPLSNTRHHWCQTKRIPLTFHFITQFLDTLKIFQCRSTSLNCKHPAIQKRIDSLFSELVSSRIENFNPLKMYRQRLSSQSWYTPTLSDGRNTYRCVGRLTVRPYLYYYIRCSEIHIQNCPKQLHKDSGDCLYQISIVSSSENCKRKIWYP